MSDQSFTQFLVDCVVRPRQAARTALGIDKTWSVVMLASVVSALVTGACVWFRLRTETDATFFTYVAPGNAAVEALLEAALTFLFLALSFPLGVFIWNRVLGWHAQAKGVVAAIVAGFGLTLITGPAFEVTLTALWAAGAATAEWIVIAASIVLSVGLTTFYFSEALGISFASALPKNIIASFLVVLIIGLPIAAITAIPILAEGVSDGATP